MATLLHMPEVAANMESATLVSWSKAVGDAVAMGDALAEIETDKAVIEYHAEAEGVLGRILVPAGQSATVGQPIGVLLAPGEQDADIDALLGQAGAREAGTASPQDAAARPVADRSAGTGTPAAVDVPGPSRSQVHQHQASRNSGDDHGRIFASPLARRLAGEAGLPLEGLRGSGPHGRIIQQDVRQALAQPPAGDATHADPAMQAVPVSATIAEAGAVRRTPHTAMRRTIARRLLESKTTVPHFYLRAECRMDELLALRQRINAGPGRRVSVNDLIVKAAAAALAESPDMNVSWSEDALLHYDAVDVAVAVATPAGLITPIVRQADSRSLSSISAEIAELVRRAREGRLQPQDYQGGTFTVSNLGMFGVHDFAAIINPPQAAILAVGATERRPIVDEQDQIVAASMMSVTLSVDHRAVDGALAAQWLKRFRRLIEAPLTILV